MYKYLNIDINSFSTKDDLSKGKETVTMDKKEFVDEHKKLVNVLNSESKEDDKKEAKEQKKELEEELEKGGEGSRGGKIIGHTKTGKAIYSNFTDSDHDKLVGSHNGTYKFYSVKSGNKRNIHDEETEEKVGEYDVKNKRLTSHHEKLSKHLKESSHKADNEDELKKSMEINSDSISRENLQKSHIGYMFGNTENLKVTKKGTEIKEKLSATKAKEQTEIAGYQARLEALKAIIPTAPSEPANDYKYDEMEMPEKLMMYPWNETYCENAKSDMVISASETKPEKSEAQILCDNKREYNRNVDKIIECQKEIILINTMLNNFNDSKTYDLSVRQAAVLGF